MQRRHVDKCAHGTLVGVGEGRPVKASHRVPKCPRLLASVVFCIWQAKEMTLYYCWIQSRTEHSSNQSRTMELTHEGGFEGGSSVAEALSGAFGGGPSGSTGGQDPGNATGGGKGGGKNKGEKTPKPKPAKKEKTPQQLARAAACCSVRVMFQLRPSPQPTTTSWRSHSCP